MGRPRDRRRRRRLDLGNSLRNRDLAGCAGIAHDDLDGRRTGGNCSDFAGLVHSGHGGIAGFGGDYFMEIDGIDVEVQHVSLALGDGYAGFCRSHFFRNDGILNKGVSVVSTPRLGVGTGMTIENIPISARELM